jgi:DNA-binding SARP family transcriptional activator/ABC-type cobalamin/Fe3+-siderophores transport system ATPase subunit
MTRLRVTLLGGFEARRETGAAVDMPAKKAQALLAYLAMLPGRAHRRDALAALLWGGIDEQAARASLRQAIFALRKALGAAERYVLVSDANTLALDPAAVDVDVVAFERLVAATTPTALESAAAVYRGDLLAGFNIDEAPFEEWLLGERDRLRERAIDALTRLLALQRTAAALAPAVQTALKLLALDPLQEPVHRTLMTVYVRQGRRDAALRQYRACVATLQRELGVEPEAETELLYQQILRQRPRRPMPTPSADAGCGDRAQRQNGELISPLIGRTSELTRLGELLSEAAGGHGQLAAIVGEAGVGKSALVAAFARRATAAGARVIIGSSYENERILPFGPWVDAFKTGSVVEDEDALGALKPIWRAELTRLMPDLDAPGLPRASDDYLRLFEGVARLVEALATARTLVMVLEDVHWADEMSVRLLAFLARRLTRARVFMVVTVRDEELADAAMVSRALEALEHQRGLKRMTLSRLSQQDTTLLVGRLVSAADTADVARLGARVWSATDGNPLMVVETMRAREEGSDRDDPQSLPVTERVRRVIAGRLERLSDRARHLAEVASVIGRGFDYALLERAARFDAEHATAAFEELVRRRVLHGGDDRLEFTHDRIRETAYGQLLPARRRLLHGHVASGMEAVHGDDAAHAAALGQHWLRAEIWDKAYACLQRAGVTAASQSAYREAVTCFEYALRALECLPRDAAWMERGIDVRFELQHALLALGAPDRTERCLREAETLAEKLGDRRRLARASAYLASSFRRLSDHERAIASARRALDLARAESDFATQALAASFLGHIYETMGEYRLALEVLTENVTALPGPLSRERFGGPGTPAVSSRCRLALSLAERGDFGEAVVRATEALELAEAVERPLDGCDAAFAEAFVHLRQGALDRALAAVDRGQAFGERGDLPIELALLASERGYATALLGRGDKAVSILEQASRDIESTGLRLRDALRATWLGEAYLLAGRIDDAAAAATRALDLARRHKERGVEAWAHRLLGQIAARRDASGSAEAEAHYRNALGLADVLGMRPLHAHCILELARLHGRARATRDALAEFRALRMDGFIALAAEATGGEPR